MPSLPTIDLLGVRVHRITENECNSHVIRCLSRGEGGWIVTPNLDHFSRLSRDRDLRELYAGASLCVADGMPLVWASRIQRTPLPGRVAGSDLVSSLSSAAASAEERCSVYYLGGAPGTAARTADILRQRYPGLIVAGTCCPQVSHDPTPVEVHEIAKLIDDSSPNVVFVALGSPKQEKLIRALRTEFPSIWWVGVGISFSFIAGDIHRAPRWMQRSGLEWAHRLTQEPRRLARRYLIEGVPFGLRLITVSAARGLFGRTAGPRDACEEVAQDSPVSAQDAHSIR